jgi:hypothetical protein
MLQKILFPIAMLTLALNAASAEDWTGQTLAPPQDGIIGPLSNPHMGVAPVGETCVPGFSALPCGPGQTLQYNTAIAVFSPVPSIPAGAGPGSGISVLVDGPYQDSSSPTGLSYFTGSVPLAAFALSSSLDTLVATTNDLSAQLNGLGGTVNGLSMQMQSLSTELAQVQQELALQDRSMRQGVAMSLAMDGTGTLGPDEHFALSMNWGTFGGQNGVAGSVAFRAADHVTFDGGIGTGFHGGLVGGRAGVRIAW